MECSNDNVILYWIKLIFIIVRETKKRRMKTDKMHTFLLTSPCGHNKYMGWKKKKKYKYNILTILRRAVTHIEIFMIFNFLNINFVLSVIIKKFLLLLLLFI